jgi:hypothetical protein
MENLIELSKVKNYLQSLKSSHSEGKVVIENLDDLMAKLATK